MAKKNTAGLPIGTYVKRSTYQKVCEENKKLKADIYMLVGMPLKLAGQEVFNKWKEHFKKDREFKRIMKELANEWFDKNPQATDVKFSELTK